MVDSTVPLGGVGVQSRKAAGVTIRLENIKKERLKTVRDPCPWVNPATVPPQGQHHNIKLPPISAGGECLSIICVSLYNLSLYNLCLYNLSNRSPPGQLSPGQQFTSWSAMF